MAALSATTQFFNAVMPYNDHNLSKPTQWVSWFAMELLFNGIGQLIMSETNSIAANYFGHPLPYFDLRSSGELFYTSWLAFASQGPSLRFYKL